MKHLMRAITFITILSLMSGCFAFVGPSSTSVPFSASPRVQVSSHTAAPSTSAVEPEVSGTTPEATKSVVIRTLPTTNEYESAELGIAFTLPDSWLGKCLIRERDGFLFGYFVPNPTIDNPAIDDYLFKVKKMAPSDKLSITDTVITVDGSEYIWTESYDADRIRDYDTSRTMRGDLAEILASLRSITSQNPPNLFVSKTTGISFTMPDSWIGKYRIEEDDGYMYVFFNPSQHFDADAGEGMLFFINRKDTELDELQYNSLMEFDIDGATYICGMPQEESYGKNQPEYETYLLMQKDIPTIFSGIRTVTGQLPGNIVYNPKPAPMNLKYTSKRLGITFSMPDSWKGKYRVVEGKGYISVCFKPEKPLTEDSGSGYLFSIEKKTKETTEESETLGDWEVKINGVIYFCFEPTDVEYAGDEEDLYLQMEEEVWAVFDSVRTAK